MILRRGGVVANDRGVDSSAGQVNGRGSSCSPASDRAYKLFLTIMVILYVADHFGPLQKCHQCPVWHVSLLVTNTNSEMESAEWREGGRKSRRRLGREHTPQIRLIPGMVPPQARGIKSIPSFCHNNNYY